MLRLKFQVVGDKGNWNHLRCLPLLTAAWMLDALLRPQTAFSYRRDSMYARESNEVFNLCYKVLYLHKSTL